MSLAISRRPRLVNEGRPDAAERVETLPRTGPPRSSGEGSRRYQMLDVWRGAICLLVVLEHAGVALWEVDQSPSGFGGWVRGWLVWALTLNIGTALFFVISGYCIASSVESSRRKGHGPLAFLTRRLWRIYPTYWAALFGFVILTLGLDAFGLIALRQHSLALELFSARDMTLSQWIGNLTLTETWRPHVFGSYEFVVTRVAWSLCYQEQFYVVCCLLLWLMPGRLFQSLAVVTGMIVAYRVFLWDCGGTDQINGTFIYAWHEFAVGLAVYWRLNQGMTCHHATRRAVEAAMALLMVIGLASEYRSTAVAGMFGLLLIGLYRWDALAGRQAWLEPLRACGRRSFSIYLTHLPVTVIGNALLFNLGVQSYWARALVMVPLVTAASVALGWWFYHLVERHFLGAPPTLVPKAVTAACPSISAQPIPVPVRIKAA